jgi:hypothetical protein
LLKALPPLARTICGVALLTGLRWRAVRTPWQVLDLDAAVPAIQEATYEGSFGTPKTVAGLRSLPLAEAAIRIATGVKGRSGRDPRI